MSDRQLLEDAARAAGLKMWWAGSGDVPVIDLGEPWNPLNHDGDALRLAVKLGLQVTSRVAEVWRNGRARHYVFEDGGNDYAATRRAIVRAAAEIWKAKA